MEKIFDKDRLMLSVVENVKYDIEKVFPKDAKALELINSLLYHLAFKLADKERQSGEMSE